jgi:GTP-binding protein HflX
MLERPDGGARAVLVGIDLGKPDFRDSQSELRLLAESAGATVVAVVEGRRSRQDPAMLAGRGKVEEIAAAAQEGNAQVVIFNHALSPAQERNLERALSCRVVDRTSLILDIFAQRARSHEGKLQVELAQLEHLSTRLVRGWTHLERQKGGIGLRGPGETQLETDRRLIGHRVKALKEKLRKIEAQRGLQRRARQRGDVFSVSIVGYTNAGKSTLFNALTNAGTFAADRLFATLDTTSRRMPTRGRPGPPIVLSDTVGFIRDLPHELVAAFRATLEETVQADLLLHVVDSASPRRDDQIADVNGVLEQIGAQSIPQILMFNKVDLTGVVATVEHDDCGIISRVWLSATKGVGLEQARLSVEEMRDRLRAARLASGSAGQTPPTTAVDAAISTG